jgi:hypothetical protein
MTIETYSVQTIRAYLLGQLPESETERLDELTVTDDDYAERVRAVEHDLVDAFARGELEGVVLDQFRSRYLTTPRRHEATRFARALQSLVEDSGGRSSSAAGHEPATPVPKTRRWRNLLPLAAALVLAVVSGWLAFDNRALRERATSAELERDQQRREAQARSATATAPPPGTGTSPLTVATLVLTPQLRSARQLPTVALSGGGGDVAVHLDLEPVDYPAYEATLVASREDRVLWRSDRLSARTVGDRQRIDLNLPAGVLGPEDYLIRVAGVPARGAPEIVGEYRFIVSR